jgi:hypothetical protein
MGEKLNASDGFFEGYKLALGKIQDRGRWKIRQST